MTHLISRTPVFLRINIIGIRTGTNDDIYTPLYFLKSNIYSCIFLLLLV